MKTGTRRQGLQLTLIAAMFGVAACDMQAAPAPHDHEARVFEVPKGASANGLTNTLASEGLITAGWKWKWFLRSTDAGCVKAGKFEVRPDMNMPELLETLCGVPIADDVPFTVVEGWRIRDIDAALVAKGWIEAGAYAAVAEGKTIEAPFPVQSPTYEGYLYPETYMVPADFNPEVLVKRQLQTFFTRFYDEQPDHVFGRPLHDIVVMASILEREEPKPSNRPLVAGILYKRLDSDTPLGADATSRYTLENWNDRGAFLANLRDPDEPYNTRLRSGLPPTAIGNPTVDSLEAAMNAESTEFWYYLHDGDGEIHPARNGDEHEANRRRYNVY